MYLPSLRMTTRIPNRRGLQGSSAGHNDAGNIAGFSATNTVINDTAGLPTVRPFLWRNGQMIDRIIDPGDNLFRRFHFGSEMQPSRHG